MALLFFLNERGQLIIAGRPKGNTGNKSRTEVSSKSKTNVDQSIAKPRINSAEEKRLYYCQSCGKPFTVQKNNFPTTQSPLFTGNNGYTNMCKTCTDKWFVYFSNTFVGNEEKAMDRMAALFDWYYNDAIMASARKISADRSRVGAYPSKMNLPQYNPHVDKSPITYLDTLKDRATVSIDSIEEFKDGGYKIPQRVVKFFGLGFDEEEYKFMSDQYDDWITRHECQTKAQEEIFKNLCVAQLNIQKASQGKINMKVDAAMTALQNLLDSANLKPKQTNDNALADQNTFGTLIKKWENEKPIPEPEEEWKDVDGIVKYITVYFLGHLCKMMGIKNSHSRAYEIEMAKYKVEKPEYEDDDEALFDSVFGGDNNASD